MNHAIYQLGKFWALEIMIAMPQWGSHALDSVAQRKLLFAYQNLVPQWHMEAQSRLCEFGDLAPFLVREQ